MNKTITWCALMVMLLTGLAIGQLYSLGPVKTQTGTASETRSGDTAAAYYEAVNELLATGDASALQSVLHPDFINHSLDTDREGPADELIDVLLTLAGTFPGLQVAASIAVIQESIVAVSLTATGASWLGEGGIERCCSSQVTGYELLRIERGTIAERWAHAALPGPGIIESLSATDIEPAPLGRDLYLYQVTLDRFTRLDLQNPEGTVLVVESGAVDVVEVDIPTGQAPRSQVSATLAPGDSRAVRSGVAFSLRNTGLERASLLLVTLDIVDFSRIQLASPAGDVSHVPGVQYELLAYGPGALADSGPLLLEARLVALPSGSQITGHIVQEAEIALIVDGHIEVGIAEGHVRQMTGQGTARRQTDQVSVVAGQAIAVSRGTEISYHAVESDTAILLLFTITPTN
ncbi:MAG: ester cyclase [Thermomicrobiales bacterium]|nr:ester cyclase [Thermomicrobiales bacterium]